MECPKADISTLNVPFKCIGLKQAGVLYEERSAVRVFLTRSDNRVVIIKALKGNYYKLPGGGIEGDEDHLKAAEREVVEETGCQASVQGGLVAMTEEYRHDLHQISYCYQAKLIGSEGKPELTEDEVADGLSHEWVPLDKALDLMSAVEPASELGRYIKERDKFLLTESLKCLRI